MAGSGHHSPVSLYALTQAAAVLRSHIKRLAASEMLTSSNKTHEMTNIRAVSSNMMKKRVSRLPNVQCGTQGVFRGSSLDQSAC